MIDIYNWFVSHLDEIVTVITGLVTVSSIVVKWTPNLKDDTVLLKIIKFLGKYIALDRTVNDSGLRAAQAEEEKLSTANKQEGGS